MYSKLFASILDSSVWLEPQPTRIVWLTLLAAKDADGFARFATIENLASRARVTQEEAAAAIATLEAPDRFDTTQPHDGRRIERVGGGWIVLNAKLYDAIIRKEHQREANRARVARHRKRNGTPEPEALTPAPTAKSAKSPLRTAGATLEASETFNRIRALKERAPNGASFIQPVKVEAVGPGAHRAFLALGGSSAFCVDAPKEVSILRAQFQKAFAEAT